MVSIKLLFLDVDGVLNYNMCKAKVGIYYGVEEEKVKLLKKIIDATDAKIVLSSTWRREITVGMPVECQTNPFAIELMSKLQAEGLKIYDMTEMDSNDSERKQQIEALIKDYRKSGQPVEAWVVLDDDIFEGFDEEEFAKHFVNTKFWFDGLSDDDVHKAIAILNGGDADVS